MVVESPNAEYLCLYSSYSSRVGIKLYYHRHRNSSIIFKVTSITASQYSVATFGYRTILPQQMPITDPPASPTKFLLILGD